MQQLGQRDFIVKYQKIHGGYVQIISLSWILFINYLWWWTAAARVIRVCRTQRQWAARDVVMLELLCSTVMSSCPGHGSPSVEMLQHHLRWEVWECSRDQDPDISDHVVETAAASRDSLAPARRGEQEQGWGGGAQHHTALNYATLRSYYYHWYDA